MKSRSSSRESDAAAAYFVCLEQVLEDLSVPVCLLNQQGVICFINQAFAKGIWGKEAELLGMSSFDVLSTEDTATLQHALRALHDTSGPLTISLTTCSDAARIEFSLRKCGAFYSLQSVASTRMHEQALALSFDRKLKEQQRQLSEILERIDDGFIALDESSRITHWNRKAEVLLGRKRDDVLTRDIWACYLEAMDSSFRRLYNKALREQRPQQYEFFVYQEEKWLEVSLYPSLNGMTAFIRDVTRNKALQEQLETQKKEHQQLITAAVIRAQEKERADVGLQLHDHVNQVLATVKLYTELCLSKPENLEVLLNKSMSLIQHCIDEIRALSWKLSAPTLGKIRMKDSIEELTQITARRGNLNVSVDYSCVSDRELSDELHLALYRIVQEQLTNVIAHADASSVEISIFCMDQQLILTIRDNGKGFDPLQKRSGIGIANMISRAEGLGGTLSLNSAPGLGCVLICQFPFEE